jgi:hypothetical protein
MVCKTAAHAGFLAEIVADAHLVGAVRTDISVDDYGGYHFYYAPRRLFFLVCQ